MKLSLKDKEFLERLRPLVDSKGLDIDFKKDCLKRLVLRKNYGDRIEQAFGMTRQGVRWRFQRLFNELYVEAYHTIFMVESLFGTALRQKALEIARERIELRRNTQKIGDLSVYRLKCRGENVNSVPTK